MTEISLGHCERNNGSHISDESAVTMTEISLGRCEYSLMEH